MTVPGSSPVPFVPPSGTFFVDSVTNLSGVALGNNIDIDQGFQVNGQWRSLADVELATAEYVDWFNTRRLHTAIGGIPPAEYEAAYYAQTQPDPEAGPNT
jgi:transposase InsO family protein